MGCWLGRASLAGLLLSPPASAQAGGAAVEPALDASRLPERDAPAVVDATTLPGGKKSRRPSATTGWSATLAEPPFEDRNRRIPQTAQPHDFGALLKAGERFRFDVTFAGNPAGLAEAEVIGLRNDTVGAPVLELRGHARTSGIVSLLATVTDDMVTHIDAKTGAAVRSQNVLRYSGWSPTSYKKRTTTHSYEGRGFVRIEDVKDEKTKKKIKHVPIDTFDPLSAMAWVRSLELKAGERAKAHAIDGTTLLRIEVESKGRQPMDPMPSIGTALGLGSEDVVLLEGSLTRVDRFDQAIPGKRSYTMRAWVSADERRIPLLLESDMWVGAIRLVLTSYDPPGNR